MLDQTEILTDSNNNIYNIKVKDNLEKNLIAIDNNCISNIIDFKEAQCELEKLENADVKEVVQGIIVFKNFKDVITHDCSKVKIKQK